VSLQLSMARYRLPVMMMKTKHTLSSTQVLIIIVFNYIMALLLLFVRMFE